MPAYLPLQYDAVKINMYKIVIQTFEGCYMSEIRHQQTKMLITANPAARDCNIDSWWVPRVYVWEPTSASEMTSRTRMLIAANPAARDRHFPPTLLYSTA
ncbi:hypothetical protein J6590_096350, partial [Homalodisca vitripennis]